MFKAIVKFLFPRLVGWAFKLATRAFEDEVAMEDHGRQSRAYVKKHVFDPVAAKAPLTSTKADNLFCAFVRGYHRYEIDEQEQEARDRVTRGEHPGI